jgi:hypothetical protein
MMRQKGFTTAEIRGGPEHEYWKYRVAEEMRKKGYLVEIEKEINGHNIDIVASSEQETIAIEIETGKSDAAINIRNDLQAGFQKVICVVLANNISKKLEDAFPQAIEFKELIIRKVGHI